MKCTNNKLSNVTKRNHAIKPRNTTTMSFFGMVPNKEWLDSDPWWESDDDGWESDDDGQWIRDMEDAFDASPYMQQFYKEQEIRHAEVEEEIRLGLEMEAELDRMYEEQEVVAEKNAHKAVKASKRKAKREELHKARVKALRNAIKKSTYNASKGKRKATKCKRKATKSRCK